MAITNKLSVIRARIDSFNFGEKGGARKRGGASSRPNVSFFLSPSLSFPYLVSFSFSIKCPVSTLYCNINAPGVPVTERERERKPD